MLHHQKKRIKSPNKEWKMFVITLFRITSLFFARAHLKKGKPHRKTKETKSEYTIHHFNSQTLRFIFIRNKGYKTFLTLLLRKTKKKTYYSILWLSGRHKTKKNEELKNNKLSTLYFLDVLLNFLTW